jgi:hypothetical protein
VGARGEGTVGSVASSGDLPICGGARDRGGAEVGIAESRPVVLVALADGCVGERGASTRGRGHCRDEEDEIGATCAGTLR